jgi:hypothetical protein
VCLRGKERLVMELEVSAMLTIRGRTKLKPIRRENVTCLPKLTLKRNPYLSSIKRRDI